MPEMDGYEASRAIRRQPGLRALPVIAMTANAMFGERAKVPEAGMNDQIAKPIDVAEMCSTLARCLTVAPQVPGQPPAAPGEPLGMAGLPTMTGVDGQEALAAVDGNAGLCRRRLRKLRQLQCDAPTRIRAARGARCHESVARIIHDLHGLAGTLGMVTLRQSAAALQSAWASDSEPHVIDACCRAMECDLEAVIAALAALGGQD